MSEVNSNAVADSTNTAPEQKTAEVKTEAKTQEAPKQDVAKEQTIGDKLYAETTAKDQKDSTTEPKKEEQPKDAFELKLPEGSLLSEKNVQEVMALAKEKGYTQEQAQLILDRENATVSAYREGLINQHKKQTEQWAATAKADPEIGGEKFTASVESAKRAFDKFGTPEFKQALEETGYGNHPELIKVFSRIGKLMSEDKFVAAGEPAAPKKPLTDIWYDNTPKKG